MNILVTLNSGIGVDSGPNYTLTANVGSVLPSSVTKTQLLAGVTVAVSNSAASITVTSIGNCTNSLVLPITGVKSATVYMNSFVDYPYGYATSGEACTLGGVTGVTSIVYYTGVLGNGTVLYFDQALTQAFNAGGSFGWYWITGQVFEYGGVIANFTTCI
jgi:hypothetical protein